MVKRNLFMLSAVVVAVVMISASVAEAQRGRGGGGFGRGGGFGGGPVELLQREDVKAELKLTDAQNEEIQELATETWNSRRERFSGFSFGSQSEEERQQTFARMREEMQKEQSKLREQVGTILNSKQRDRLGELEFQFQLRRGSARAALAAGGVELSESDREKLEEARREIDEKINAQIAEIRLNAQKEIMGSVVSESQIERMIGDPFEFQQQERRARGAFGAAGGGRERGDRAGRARRRPAAEEDDSSDNEESGGNRRRRRR